MMVKPHPCLVWDLRRWSIWDFEKSNCYRRWVLKSYRSISESGFWNSISQKLIGRGSEITFRDPKSLFGGPNSLLGVGTHFWGSEPPFLESPLPKHDFFSKMDQNRQFFEKLSKIDQNWSLLGPPKWSKNPSQDRVPKSGFETISKPTIFRKVVKNWSKLIDFGGRSHFWGSEPSFGVRTRFWGSEITFRGPKSLFGGPNSLLGVPTPIWVPNSISGEVTPIRVTSEHLFFEVGPIRKNEGWEPHSGCGNGGDPKVGAKKKRSIFTPRDFRVRDLDLEWAFGISIPKCRYHYSCWSPRKLGALRCKIDNSSAIAVRLLEVSDRHDERFHHLEDVMSTAPLSCLLRQYRDFN